MDTESNNISTQRMKKPESKDSFDAVVVGSGYGGSVAACRMSMAGFKVRLLEKGRKWEALDFPTGPLEMLCAARVHDKNTGLDFGSRDALFQVHVQGDAVAAVACGLGGGSLVNAGVMAPAPARARRHPRWPEAWDQDWEACQVSAENMLRVQSVPAEFGESRIAEEFDPIKLSMDFEGCLGCGNCLAGCPYGAKNSTDKTYLVSAVQAGCSIKTECEVQYVLRNYDDDDDSCKSRRRWLVYLNEFDYIESDIVVLSAGVLGTTKILFQSQLRGLRVSRKLGSGLSCNGNNVAYLAGSSSPLNSTGLDRKHFPNIPFHQRPGPSISSSYTSSLGFTIQSGVIPSAYPTFLFKGITTYECRTEARMFPYILTDWLNRILGFNRGHDMVLNAMGHDASDGKLKFEKGTNTISFHPPRDHLLPRKVEAFRKLAKKLSGTLFMSRFSSTSVHLLGGCIVSSDISSGVCNSNGQVFDATSGVHLGLYVCDASLIPCSVGINPCLTIASAAEHVSKRLVRDHKPASVGSISRGSNKIKTSDSVTTAEIMRGQVGGMQCTAYLKLRFQIEKNNSASPLFLRGRVGGYIECRAIEADTLYVVGGEVNLCGINTKTPYTQYMNYCLVLAASSGSRYVLEGKKVMNPFLLGLYAWRESTTLSVTLRKIAGEDDNNTTLKGKLHISLVELLKSVWALQGGNRFKFIYLLLGSVFRTYIVQTPRPSLIDTPVSSGREPYPNSTIHEIKTGDSLTISCEHWQCNDRKHTDAKRKYPALLLNGYSTESYRLPTEKNDLVRTLLNDGHDVWILHAREHCSISSNQFSVEDIGRFDIPAVIDKMIDSYGESMKTHVVAHCLGGLAIHISIMGAHISPKHIASLCCTNSSMFYKVTTSSLVKMWLPIVPMSMAILGSNKTLPMHEDSSTHISYRHSLLKSIARLIPRYHRCHFDECEVLSGIFGNIYLHENISDSMHHWMHKENLPTLTMAAFPHLRKICKTGFIVDAKGNNSYLIYPERMAMPTLYISGGSALIVTAETSFLGNKYMKMHQPGYRHERVVIDGFGHNDLLIGEKSADIVFPHIRKHAELAEEEIRDEYGNKKKSVKETLAWSVDPHDDEEGFMIGSWVFTSMGIVFVVMVFFRLFSFPQLLL